MEDNHVLDLCWMEKPCTLFAMRIYIYSFGRPSHLRSGYKNGPYMLNYWPLTSRGMIIQIRSIMGSGLFC